jgi:photosystem II stability/assembly factor-like uncharacterized protein
MLFSTAHAQELVWEQTNGPYGGEIHALLATTEGVLYAGTWGGGLFRSMDGGDSWTAVNAGLTSTTIWSLAVSGTTLYASTNGGVFRSEDEGQTWFPANTGLPSTGALAVSGTVLYAGTSGGGVFRSRDGGDSWTAVNTGLTSAYVEALAVSGTTLYAGTTEGIFRSEDDGDSWTAANTGLTSTYVQTFSVSGTTIYAGTLGGGVFRSDDGGDSWTAATSGLTNTDIRALQASGTTVYAGTSGGGVFRSDDGGDSWTAINTGLSNASIRALAVSGATLYAGTYGSGVFRAEPTRTVSLATPAPGQVLPLGATSAELSLSADSYPGLWHWRLDEPFTGSGPAGENAVLEGTTAAITGFTPGKHTVYVTLVDAAGYVLDPSVTDSVSFFIAAGSHAFDYVLPRGLSLFSTALDPKLLSDSNDTIDIDGDGGVCMARHLVQLGSTVVIGMEDSKFHPVIGRDGVLLVGQDFPIEVSKAYVVNMLKPTGIHMEGMPHGVPIEGAPSAPSIDEVPVWAFAVAGELADPIALPEGTALRVLHTRTGQTRSVSLKPDGQFITAFVDGGQREVVAPGDVLRFELVTRDGYAFGPPTEHRVSREDMRQAFATVTLRALPQQSRLLPNYPNPFNPETWIPFELREAANVSIGIYNPGGELVRELDVGHREPGYHVSRGASAHWDGRNRAGESVSSGLYFYELRAGTVRQTRRMVISE